MNPLQAAYNWIKGIRLKWLCDLLGMIQRDILEPAFKAVDEAGVEYIRARIIEEAGKAITGDQKFLNVWNACRVEFTVDNIKDHLLDTIIQNIYSKMKVDNEV